MKPTKNTYWHYCNARAEGASATACIKAKAYGLARCHADRAKQHWLLVEWEREA